MEFSDVNIRCGLEFQIYGWGFSRVNLFHQNIETFNVTEIDAIGMEFSECRGPFNQAFLDDDINTCARVKNNGRISLVVDCLNLLGSSMNP